MLIVLVNIYSQSAYHYPIADIFLLEKTYLTSFKAFKYTLALLLYCLTFLFGDISLIALQNSHPPPSGIRMFAHVQLIASCPDRSCSCHTSPVCEAFLLLCQLLLVTDMYNSSCMCIDN